VYKRITKNPADLDRTYIMNARWSKRMRFACRESKMKQMHWIYYIIITAFVWVKFEG